MNIKNYNIFFHLHTVSGIVISVLLYVIFFTGSFSFFRDEIVNWERGHTVEVLDDITMDVHSVVEKLEQEYTLYGRDIKLKHFYNERRFGVSLTGSKDSLATEANKVGVFFYMDTHDKTIETYKDSYSLGEFLYRLHFLAQIPYPIGYYLSGFIAFFFLFALITGVLIHWKKIISNFYVFRPWAKLKTIWTDAHTALGLIGLPFQFVYAVTGAFFMIKLLLVAPSIAVLYDGDQKRLYDDLEYSEPGFSFTNSELKNTGNIDSLISETREKWHAFKITDINIYNYQDQNMHVSIGGALDYKEKFNGVGNIVYKVADGSIVSEKSPILKSSYLDGVKNILYRLHYGDYGGYLLKIISFLMGLLGCFVIISGVLIWLVARDKKNIPEKKRRFNKNVVRYYLAICLSMYPITALSFILVKLYQPAGMSFLYYTYFIGWLLMSLFFIFKNGNYFTNKYTLLSGSILGLLIPITNGLVSGNWIWKSYREGYHQIFFVDVFWILLSIATFLVVLKLKKKKKTPLNMMYKE